MTAHRIETRVDENGAVHLTGLPFQPGDSVEVIVLERAAAVTPQKRHFTMRGLPHAYVDPLEPAVSEADWEVYNPSSDAP